jgi:hypothetical protein
MKSDFLRNEIEADIVARDRNLTLMKTLPSRYPDFREEDKACWERCSFPIIYAEWEGFFVSAFQLYLREINKLGLKINELSKHYLLRETECRFRQLKEYPKEMKKRQNFLLDLMTYFREDSPLILKLDVNTESNLGYGIMNGILNYFNLSMVEDHIDHDAYSLKDDMDKFMLYTRNGIAHGDPTITATTADITKAIALVKRLMYVIEDVLCEGFDNEVYKA